MMQQRGCIRYVSDTRVPSGARFLGNLSITDISISSPSQQLATWVGLSIPPNNSPAHQNDSLQLLSLHLPCPPSCSRDHPISLLLRAQRPHELCHRLRIPKSRSMAHLPPQRTIKLVQAHNPIPGTLPRPTPKAYRLVHLPDAHRDDPGSDVLATEHYLPRHKSKPEEPRRETYRLGEAHCGPGGDASVVEFTGVLLARG